MKDAIDEIELRKKCFEEFENENNQLIDQATGLLSTQYSNIINCPLCESACYSNFLFKKGYSFVRCTACGLVYTNPQVDEKKLNELYGKSQANDLWSALTLNEKERAWKDLYYREHLSIINELSGHKPLRILDVGCATGQFITIAHEMGNEVAGIELSKYSYEHLKNNSVLDVYNCTLEEANFTENSFDVVTLFGVLEHLPKPKDIIKQVKRILKNDGLLLVIVPNVYSLYNILLREKSETFNGRNHLVYYSLETLNQFFQSEDFRIEHQSTVLTGLPRILRQMQFLDPYDDKGNHNFLPIPIKKLTEGGNSKIIENFILQQDMGLRIRMIGRLKK